MNEMNALVLEKIDGLKYKKVARPMAENDEVLIKIKACGICSSDIPRIFTTGTYHFPTIPGHEFSGIIEEVGKNVDSSLIGKRAAVFPLLPCFNCESCRKQQYAQCKKYNYFGSRCDGGFAEYIAVPEWNLVPFEDSLDYKLGALCEPLAVALHAFKSIDIINSDETIAVIGTGTIGLMIGMIAKYSGVKNVVICGRNKEKNNFAKNLGFETVSIENENFDEHFLEQTNEKGADAVFEAVGTSEAVNLAIKASKTAGKIVLVGNPYGDITIEKSVYWKILRQQITVKGIWNSQYGSEKNDWTEAVSLLEKYEKDFKVLITDVFDLKHFKEAFDLIRYRKKMSMKVMFEI